MHQLKKLQENKLKFYKNLKKHEVVEELHKRNINFTCNSEVKVLQNLLDMEMHGIQGLPALLFGNPQKTLKKLVWKDMKFSTMTHYITSSTACKIFTMNCQNTSLKYKKGFKQIYTFLSEFGEF